MDELAAQYCFTYEVAKPDIDESAIRHPDAHQLVLLLAHAKAAAIRAKLAATGRADAGLLITCDQVVLHENHILEKPADEAQVSSALAVALGKGIVNVSMPGLLSQGSICMSPPAQGDVGSGLHPPGA
jgi:predicted house-cleaning NTP pyrophosphatase (Maf/HAM1 superfamily)